MATLQRLRTVSGFLQESGYTCCSKHWELGGEQSFVLCRRSPKGEGSITVETAYLHQKVYLSKGNSLWSRLSNDKFSIVRFSLGEWDKNREQEDILGLPPEDSTMSSQLDGRTHDITPGKMV